MRMGKMQKWRVNDVCVWGGEGRLNAGVWSKLCVCVCVLTVGVGVWARCRRREYLVFVWAKYRSRE